MGRTVFLAALLLVVAAVAGLSLLRLSAEPAGGGGGWGGTSPVSAHIVGTERFSDIVEGLGTANANESVVVTSRVTDVISRLAFDSGDFVEVGAVLAVLADNEETADLAEAQATLDEANQELDRVNELNERGVTSGARVDEARAAVERARARVRSIEARLADRIVRAPFAGVVGLRNTSTGALVRPGDPIVTLDDVSIIKLDFTAPEVFLSTLQRGAPIEARSDAFPGEVFVGEIAQVDSRVDPVTRAVTVRVEIDNRDGRLRPGMLMVVEVEKNSRESIAIPELALLREADTAFVYQIVDGEEGLTLRRTTVRTGVRRGGFVEIQSGLEPGDRVVDEGTHRVRPGMMVEVVDEESSARAPRKDDAA